MYTSVSITIILFFSPKIGTCKTCDTYKVRMESETDRDKQRQLRGEWDLHLCKAKRAYQELSEATALSKSDLNVDVITFDLQQSLPTPVLTTNVVYYKRQLWTYNLGVHNCRYKTFLQHSFTPPSLPFLPPSLPPALIPLLSHFPITGQVQVTCLCGMRELLLEARMK